MIKFSTYFLLLISFIFNTSIAQTAKQLYPIVDNGVWGYIDNKGEITINPKFRVVGQFSEGLAPVRLDGTYGFINKEGDFVIEPIYDVAFEFRNGLAKVYTDGKPYLINSKGQIAFEHNFAEIFSFDDEQNAIVKTNSHKFGLINKSGDLIADTVYSKINPFSEGLAVVTGINHDPYAEKGEKKVSEIGVINSSGKLIVPYGKYREISDFSSGHAIVELDVKSKNEYANSEAVIDSTGAQTFVIPAKRWHLNYGSQYFSEGLATIQIYKVDPESIKVWSSKNSYTYAGVINSDGKILFRDKSWEEITTFRKGRAFIKNKKGWFLINKSGEVLNNRPYDEIQFRSYNRNVASLFQNGAQLVKVESSWKLIDIDGEILESPKELGLPYTNLIHKGSIIFIHEDISLENNNYSYRYGFWNTNNGKVIVPQFHYINQTDFNSELIYVKKDGLMGYINQNGEYIWQEKQYETPSIQKLNIDYMNRGYFYASSPDKKKLRGLGGWGKSKNGFVAIDDAENYKPGELNLVVDQEKDATFRESYEGMKLYAANMSKDTLFFSAQNSRLYLKIQAKDKNGIWQDIEYTPSSWCGNSYHTLFLPPKHQWEFVIPKYEGVVKTVLRAQLKYKEKLKQKKSDIIYSIEFEGNINPAQFWRKKPYYPSGIMDPYNE